MPEQSTLGVGKVCNDLRLNSRCILNDALHLSQKLRESGRNCWVGYCCSVSYTSSQATCL